MKSVFLIGTRWFGILGPCQLIIDKLVSEGFKVFVIGAKDDKYQQFDYSKVELIEVNFKRSYFSIISDLLDLIKIVKLGIKFKPLHIHSFNPKPSFFALVLKKVFKAKLYIGVTGLGNTFIKNNSTTRIFRKLIEYTYNSADSLFFQNNDDVEFFSNFITDLSKIKKFTSPGVDIERFKYVQRDVNKNQLNVLFVGRLLWQKGVDDFIAAEKMFAERYPDLDVNFNLVGPADYEHPDRLKLDDIEKIKLSSIVWVEWVEKIEEIYYQNDLLVFMSHREGGPRAILEAASTGMPVIGSNAIGVKELVIDDITGFLVNLHDISDIVEKIKFYYDNADVRYKHGRNGRNMIAEEYSLEKASNAQLEMYELNI